jgi:serine/threonine protein kinase
MLINVHCRQWWKAEILPETDGHSTLMSTCPVCDYEYEDSLVGCPRHSHDLPSDKIVDEKKTTEAADGQALIGTTISALYRLDEIIGKGAMGVVYKALHLKDNKEVAIKVLHTHLAADPESIKRFQHEARAASSLMHANIVRIYDVGVAEGGQPYIVMELLDGVTLSRFLRERQHLDTSEALPLIRQACEAIAEAHSNGVLHRDIKPANIVLCNRFGVENFVLVLDFSIAKIIQKVSDVDSTTPGLIFGSPTYMSPERFMGKGGDFRSDIYSMGIIMFQLLAGRPPFKSADLYTLMNEHINTPPPRVRDFRPQSDVPELLEQAIAKALAKRPEDRQENMKQLLAEINEVYHTVLAPKEEPAMSQPVRINSNDRIAALGGQRTNADGSFAPFASAGTKSAEKPAVYGFEIDPTIGISPPGGSLVYGSGRKPTAVEESNSNRQKLAEFGNNARWDKSLISGKSSTIVTAESIPVQRQRIRPAEEQQQLPIELIALALVLVLFFWIISPRIMPVGKTSAPVSTTPL